MHASAALCLLLWTAPSAWAKQPAPQVMDAPFSTSAQGPSATLRISKSQGLWNFLCALISREEGDQRALAALFDKSAFNTPRYTDQFRQYRAVCEDPELWFEVATASARAESLLDFHRRLPQALALSSNDPKTVARNADIVRGVLVRFAPVYDQLVWRPSLQKIRLVQRRLMELSKKTDFSDLYSRAAAFYRSSYDGSVLIALTPIPAGTGGRQPLLKDVFLFEIPLHEKTLDPGQLASSYGVIFHELCHILYDHKPAEVEDSIKDIVGDRPHSDGVFNEGVAIAMGMWAERKLTGQDKNWGENCSYDERTCAFTQALYPKVVSYLEARRAMDKEFFAFAKEQYALLPASKSQKTVTPEMETAALEAAVADIKTRPAQDPDRAKALTLSVLKRMAETIRYAGDVPQPAPRDPHEWPGLRVLVEGDFNGCVEAAKVFKTLFDASSPPRVSKYVGGTLKGEDGGHAVVEVADEKGRAFLVETSMFSTLDLSIRGEADLAKPEGRTIQTGEEDINVRRIGQNSVLSRYEYMHLFQEDKRLAEPLEFKDLASVNAWLRGNVRIADSFQDLEKAGLILAEDKGTFRGPGGRTQYIFEKVSSEPFSGTEEARRRQGHLALEEAVKRSPAQP